MSELAEEKSLLMMAVIKALPYPGQIVDLDLGIDSIEIRLTWRGHRLKVSEGGFVEEAEGAMLACSDLAILMEKLVKKELL